MSIPDPFQFSAAWEAAWNAHDLDALLAHFHDDVVFTSPKAASILPDTRGIVRGKEQLRAYWAEGLRLIPDLHFTVVDVHAGVATLVIQYRNQTGDLVDEVLVLGDDARVVEGHATYRPATVSEPQPRP
ncbi:nuclear transport factor 2 family protein [Cellulomonas sp. URHE0023]|uniref:nuclear transport factor 2 family protein n=1 Tax=Cellulomonas sp. URHE0023 TaxID=1380354 RepID=UPI00054DE969|nr:nuclear transport factor 2 family protein [Cellulomonas sp. URHE0023]